MKTAFLKSFLLAAGVLICSVLFWMFWQATSGPAPAVEKLTLLGQTLFVFPEPISRASDPWILAIGFFVAGFLAFWPKVQNVPLLGRPLRQLTRYTLLISGIGVGLLIQQTDSGVILGMLGCVVAGALIGGVTMDAFRCHHQIPQAIYAGALAMLDIGFGACIAITVIQGATAGAIALAFTLCAFAVLAFIIAMQPSRITQTAPPAA